MAFEVICGAEKLSRGRERDSELKDTAAAAFHDTRQLARTDQSSQNLKEDM